MPRIARKKSRSGIYHVMLRGVNKQMIFEDDVDRIRFLETIKKYRDQYKYSLYGYCLMDNHVHLLLKEEAESVSESVKRISSSYVYWYNIKYDRYGHLFQDRFKSEVVESIISFLKVLRYIHQNPLKAGLTGSVFESKWSSVNEYFVKSDIVDIDYGLELFSNIRNDAIKLYKEYMGQPNDDECLDDHVRIRVTDSEVKDYLSEMGITHVSLLQQMDKEKRDLILSRLKEMNGVSIRQLSRVTGVSRSVINRVGQRDRWDVP
ncbi:transposase [Metabacillus endolithicus]|uniref:Transposase n=2 Tax=Metabacillus endolithicus TaxID=1535204 RepID=A0ABW5BZZ4_9BACI|nr:transposase [Metabacillus endolithicus]UPG65499.1 transposase [Metabacillus endolithicus]